MSQKLLKNLLLIFTTLLTISFQQEVHASHAMGADLTYTCLENDQYEITLTFYRDCDGTNAPTTPTINISSASCGVSTSITLTQQGTGQEISPLCSSQISQSTCNGGTLQGVEKYTYTGLYTLPSMCNDWMISFSECCRNGAITNSDGPQNYDLFVSANIDNLTVSCNSSPTFTTPPVPYICAGQPFNYNHGAFDAEGDSLVYTLIAPYDNATATVPYAVGFSSAYPISTTPPNQFGFDPLTGQISFTPDGIQIGIVTVLVEEYRNGVLIGHTIRDMQVVVISCSNNVPVVVPPDPSEVMGGIIMGSTFQVCAGNTLSFEIDGSDLDAADVLTVTSNIATSIPGATINTIGTNPVVIQFNWPTTFNDLGIYNFTISVSDGACPTPGNQILGYDILVPGVNIVADDTTVCENITQIIQLDALPIGGSGNGTYSWSPVTGLDNPNIPNPIATVDGPASYIITYNDGVCLIQDTIDIIFSGILTATPEISNICPNESVQLNADYIFTVEPPLPGCGFNLDGCNGASNSITVGTNVTASGPATTSNEAGSPFLGYYEDGRVQYLFRASELQALGMTAGLITDLAFDITTVNSTAPYDNFNIKLACVEDTILNVVFLPNALTVYSGSVTPVLGTNNFTLSTPYEWDGLSNIVVEVCFDNNNYTSFDHVSYTSTPFTSVIYQRVDNSSGCTLGGSVTDTNRRANITFNTCQAQSIFQNVVYSWSPAGGLSNPNISNPVATPSTSTSYVITAVTDECTFMDTIQVNVQPLAIDVTSQIFGCGGSNGSLNVTVSTGTAPYTYVWSNGLPGIPTHPNVPVGTYTVTVTDATGCSNTDSIMLNAGVPLSISATGNDLLCNGDINGQLTSTASGGIIPYTFMWSSGQTVQNPDGLPTGTYYVTVSDISGCVETASATITEPPPIQIPTTQVDPNCNQNDGSITVNANGGNPTYQYNINGGTFQVSNLFNGLGAGNYAIGVLDTNGCTETTIIMLNTILSPVIDSISTTDPSCMSSDGEIVVNASGGVTPLQYSNNGGALQSSNVFNNLPQGNYTILVQDVNGCTSTASVTLSDLSGPSVSATFTNENCSQQNGTITLMGSGGIPPYTYSNDNGVTFQTSNTFTGIGAATYDIVLADTNGCQASTQVTISNLSGPAIDSLNITNTICSADNGVIIVNVSGGNQPYSYSINNGIAQASNTFSGLTVGMYILLVTDANGCIDTDQVNIFDFPGPTITNVTVTDPTCSLNNGTISIFVDGGIPPIQYSIDNGGAFQTSSIFTNLAPGNYPIIAQDFNGCSESFLVTLAPSTSPEITNTNLTHTTCNQADGAIEIFAGGGMLPLEYSIDNGMNYQTSNMFSGLGAATYNVVVIDAVGCTDTLIVVLSDPNAPVIDNINTINPNCNMNNGSIEILISGGTPNYEYSINGGTTFQGSNVFDNLNAGVYSIIVVDFNGCSANQTLTLNNPGAPEVATINTLHPTCGNIDGSIEIIATSGTTPYSYSIDNGVTFQPSNLFTGLNSGVYNIIVMDDADCEVTDQIMLTNTGGLTINLIDTTDPTCEYSNGSISLQVNGGTLTYEYSIDNGITFQPGSVFNNLPPDTYNIVIQDDTGCLITDIVVLSTNGLPTLDITTQNTNCTETDGSIDIQATGGTTPFQYSIDNGATFTGGNIFDQLGAGTYEVVVVDFNGCISSETVIVDNSSTNPVNIIPGGSTDICDGEMVALNAGSGFVTYDWSTEESTQIIEAAASGIYSVTATDANGCPTVDEIEVTVAAPIDLDVVQIETVELGETVEVTVLFPDPTQTYNWTGSDGTTYSGPSFTYYATAQGIYTFTVTSTISDCTVSAVVSFAVEDSSVLAMPNAFSPNGDGFNDTYGPLIGGSLRVIEFKVYNRWGEKVHDDPTSDWNGLFRGKEQEQDVYVYQVTVESMEGIRESRTSDVHLLR